MHLRASAVNGAGGASTDGAVNVPYQLPPKEIQQLVDAAIDPAISVAPQTREYFLLYLHALPGGLFSVDATAPSERTDRASAADRRHARRAPGHRVGAGTVVAGGADAADAAGAPHLPPFGHASTDLSGGRAASGPVGTRPAATTAPQRGHRGCVRLVWRLAVVAGETGGVRPGRGHRRRQPDQGGALATHPAADGAARPQGASARIGHRRARAHLSGPAARHLRHGAVRVVHHVAAGAHRRAHRRLCLHRTAGIGALRIAIPGRPIRAGGCRAATVLGGVAGVALPAHCGRVRPGARRTRAQYRHGAAAGPHPGGVRRRDRCATRHRLAQRRAGAGHRDVGGGARRRRSRSAGRYPRRGVRAGGAVRGAARHGDPAVGAAIHRPAMGHGHVGTGVGALVEDALAAGVPF
eukprot:ctg_2165.g424